MPPGRAQRASSNEARAREMLTGVRAAGLKLTPQRIAIVRELAGDPSHPTAQEIFDRLQSSMPTMSFATVYNTLDALARAGLMRLALEARRNQDPSAPQGRLRGRVAGEPPLPVLRQGGRRGGPPGRRGPVQGHGGRRDRPRARPPRLPQAGGRPGDGPADRQHREEPQVAVAGETHEYETMYPGMAKDARAEGFDDIAEWFETLAKAEKSHAGASRRRSTASTSDRHARRRAWTAGTRRQAVRPRALLLEVARVRMPSPRSPDLRRSTP
jgi:hypothetical protein